MFQIVSILPEAKNAWSYGSNLVALDSNINSLVYASTDIRFPPLATGPPPLDPFFGVCAEDTSVVAMQRVTEYCQWQEFEHRNRKRVGKDPDYCTKKSVDPEDTACSRESCSYSRESSCTSSKCCSWQIGDDIFETEISYSYLKGWHSYRINSLIFDNPAAFHNPQRDPAPSSEFYSSDPVDLSGGVTPSSLQISPTNLETVLNPWKPLYITKGISESLNSRALNAGFSEISHLHIYSRVPKDGWENPVLKAAASYLIDGVVDVNNIASASGIESLLGRAGLDWITKGTCNAGDVRIYFETRSLPLEISTIGNQKGNLITPHTYSNGVSQLFIAAKVMDAAALCELHLSNHVSSTNLYRFIVFVLFLFGAYLDPDQNNFFNAILVATTFFAAFLSLCWLFYYGVPNSNIAYAGIAIAMIGAIIIFRNKNSKESKSKEL